MVEFQKGYIENIMDAVVGWKVESVGHRIDVLGLTEGT
jgi:hypothetical protein